jgi:hypothetical protein
MTRALNRAGLVTCALFVTTSALAQEVSSSTTFQQFINSPPELVCTGNASIQYEGGVLMRAEVQIVDSQGQLKARACQPASCWASDYTPSNPISVEVRYNVNLDNDPSGNYNCVLDGTVQLDYSQFVNFSGGSTQTVEPRVPADLKKADVADDYTFNGLGDYLRVRTWQVWDNYQLHWTYANMPISENYSYGQNGCNITVAIASGYTQPNGTFPDRYGNYNGTSTIPACQVVPSCTTQTTQTIYVAGTPFSHGVTWGCTDVQISRQ